MRRLKAMTESARTGKTATLYFGDGRPPLPVTGREKASSTSTPKRTHHRVGEGAAQAVVPMELAANRTQGEIVTPSLPPLIFGSPSPPAPLDVPVRSLLAS